MIFDVKLEALLNKILEQGIRRQKIGTSVNLEVSQKAFGEIIEHLQTNKLITSTFNNKMICSGNGYSRIQLKSLAEWLIYNSKKIGVQETMEQLDEYLEHDYTPAIAILAVSGIEPSERIQLSDTIELIPFVDLPPSKAKNALYPSFMQDKPGFDILNPVFSAYNPPKAALVKKLELRPQGYDKEKPDPTTIEYQDLYEACEFLTLHLNATPLPAGDWIELDEEVPCKQMMGSGFSYPTLDVFSKIDIPISIDHWNQLKSIYQNFVQLDQETRDYLRIPFQRLNQARRRQRDADKAIDQGIAYEALFLNDKSHIEQISFMLRLRASLLLGNNVEERQELINFFKSFYSCRSQATHTGKLDSRIKIANRGKTDVNKLLEESDQLCIDSITKIINNGGFPDWNKLMLGVGLDVE